MPAYSAELLFHTTCEEALRVVSQLENKTAAALVSRYVWQNSPSACQQNWALFCAEKGVDLGEYQGRDAPPDDPILTEFRNIASVMHLAVPPLIDALKRIACDPKTRPEIAAFCHDHAQMLIHNCRTPFLRAATPGASPLPSPSPTPRWKGKAREIPPPGTGVYSGSSLADPFRQPTPHVYSMADSALDDCTPPSASVSGSTHTSHPTGPPAMPPTYEYSAGAAFGEGAHYTKFYPLTGSLDYGRDVFPIPAQRPYKIPRTTMEDLFSPAERKDMREPEREFLKSVGL